MGTRKWIVGSIRALLNATNCFYHHKKVRKVLKRKHWRVGKGDYWLLHSSPRNFLNFPHCSFRGSETNKNPFYTRLPCQPRSFNLSFSFPVSNRYLKSPTYKNTIPKLSKIKWIIYIYMHGMYILTNYPVRRITTFCYPNFQIILTIEVIGKYSFGTC